MAAPWRDVSKGGEIGFSFTRSDCDPDAARRDLGLAVEALAAKIDLDAAFAEAQFRLANGDDSAFEEQQRLHGLREAMISIFFFFFFFYYLYIFQQAP